MAGPPASSHGHSGPCARAGVASAGKDEARFLMGLDAFVIESPYRELDLVGPRWRRFRRRLETQRQQARLSAAEDDRLLDADHANALHALRVDRELARGLIRVHDL